MCWLGMPMCHTILIQREKCNVNASLLAGNANVIPNSDLKKGKGYASLFVGNANVPPNSDSKGKDKINALLFYGNANVLNNSD
jgi:hypothetical protein